MAIEGHQEKLHFQAEVKQLLDIVIHSLYSNKEIFLRELISNASDAIDKLRFHALSDAALYESDTTLNIHVSFDASARTITISDNGIGMSREEVIDNLGTIAKSGTREFLSRLTGDEKKDAHLIGQFGVGFYSAFIVADKVTVLTRRAGLGQEHGVCWESQGGGDYTIANVEKISRGTDIILHLKKDEDEFLNAWRLRSIITKYSDHLNIPILMPKTKEDGTTTDEWETVNRATALWALPKSTVTAEQYQEFYKHISHDFEHPLIWTHHKIEGGHLEYISILYIPSHAPFDLWQRDTHHGLKLYVQRVFIMDQVEQFLPYYLRFVKGVIDTTALPLNISREILQDHAAISKLRSALTRHVLDLLEKLAQDDPEKYKTFWSEFGAVLKEGPAEDFSNRERIAKLLRFTSTHDVSGAQSVSLEDYIKRMKANQKKIYYITAENSNAAKSSPHLEVFHKNNIEVLLLSDRIDEWLVGHLAEFEGKPLQSVAKGDLQLDEIMTESEKANQTDEQKKDEKQLQAFDPLLKKMQSILEDKVKEVRLSHRLTSSPACLVRDQNALGPQMERLLKAAGQAVMEAKPVFELNPEHTIIRQMNSEMDEERFKEWTELLYEQALLAEGSTLPDPAIFVQRMNKIWMALF
ncbi:MAG: molecular chaperone HtpG [Gammaproteobacteria bacterium RIFCSPHIGHO2_12_FULL_38_14]|nr:MAG: molecular chaperone HtpG [Gammaproteobacteria bacterium RIFCSPHIGHO2_12_FULL_38_14]